MMTSVKKKTKLERGYIRGNDQEDFLEVTSSQDFTFMFSFLQWSPNISYVLPCPAHQERGGVKEWDAKIIKYPQILRKLGISQQLKT